MPAWRICFGPVRLGPVVDQTSPVCLLEGHYGLMFWFSRKKLSGSYLRFSATSLSYFASP